MSGAGIVGEEVIVSWVEVAVDDGLTIRQEALLKALGAAHNIKAIIVDGKSRRPADALVVRNLVTKKNDYGPWSLSDFS